MALKVEGDKHSSLIRQIDFQSNLKKIRTLLNFNSKHRDKKLLILRTCLSKNNSRSYQLNSKFRVCNQSGRNSNSNCSCNSNKMKKKVLKESNLSILHRQELLSKFKGKLSQKGFKLLKDFNCRKFKSNN